MERFENSAKLIYAIGLIGLATIGFSMGDFIIGRPPACAPDMHWLFSSSNILVVAGSIGIITKKFGYWGSLISGFAILLFSYLLKIIPAFSKSDFIGIINNGSAWKILALTGGCLILANSFKKNTIFLKSGLVAITCFFMWAGIAHFLYSSFVDTLIPDYIPFHRFWTYFCGICLILASIGLWIPKLKRLVASLSGAMIFGWFLLLHIPRFLLHPSDKTELMGVVESMMFAALMMIVSFNLSTKESGNEKTRLSLQSDIISS
jgi:hypothetical protein